MVGAIKSKDGGGLLVFTCRRLVSLLGAHGLGQATGFRDWWRCIGVDESA